MDIATANGIIFNDSKENDFMIYGDIDNKNILIGTDILSESAIKISENSITFNKEVIINGLTNFLPVGTIMPYAGTAAPFGWLLCDGSEYSNTIYADLKNTLNFLYGGSTVSGFFNVPNMEDKYVVGTGTAQNHTFNLGQVQNQNTQSILDVSNDIIKHTHNIPSFTEISTTANHSHSFTGSININSSVFTGNTVHEHTVRSIVMSSTLENHTHRLKSSTNNTLVLPSLTATANITGTGHNHENITYAIGNHTHTYESQDGGSVDRQNSGQSQSIQTTVDANIFEYATPALNATANTILNTDEDQHPITFNVNTNNGSHSHIIDTNTNTNNISTHTHNVTGTTLTSDKNHYHLLQIQLKQNNSLESSVNISPIYKTINYIIKY